VEDVSVPVSTLDIAPTILDTCGIDDTPASFLGTSLREPGPRPVYGQSFYRGVSNNIRQSGPWHFYLTPFPGPVKEICREVSFRIDGRYQVIHDSGRNRTELHRLSGGPRSAPPVTATVRDAMVDYFRSVYKVPEKQTVTGFSEQDKEVLSARLAHLGYM
jgi:hypothetical protein